MNRIGVIKSVENKIVTFFGYGEFKENKLVENDDIGIEVEVPVFKFDTGTIMENCYGYYWSDEEIIKDELKLYKTRGYTIHSLDI